MLERIKYPVSSFCVIASSKRIYGGFFLVCGFFCCFVLCFFFFKYKLKGNNFEDAFSDRTGVLASV